MKLNHILLVSQNIEKEQALFDWTLALAKVQQAKVTVLRVLPEVEPGLAAWLSQRQPSELAQAQREQALSEMRPWQQAAQGFGVALVARVEFGKLFYKAIQAVIQQGMDLVVKQIDTPEQGVSRILFGTQDLHLLRKCPCPVLLHKSDAGLPFKRVMASVDVDIEAENLVPNRLNQLILDMASLVVQHEQADLTVVHAWQAEAENLMRYWNSDLSEADVQRFSEQMRQQHLRALEYDIAAYRETLAQMQVLLPKGRATQVIAPLVEQQQIDLLVMGTLGRSGLPGLVIGNTAETILEQIQCSVLVVKPEGFVSPITV
ncbi:MAG: universal stress protein [Thiomicrospira sp.]|jgi:nucleotide-binding universal stress UspA family protein